MPIKSTHATQKAKITGTVSGASAETAHVETDTAIGYVPIGNVLMVGAAPHVALAGSQTKPLSR
jgi:hypothetical protein